MEVQAIPFDVFQAFMNVFKKNGVEGTMKILNKGGFETSIKDPYIVNVLKLVSEEFSMDLNDILYDRYVRGENKYVIGFCVYYLFKEYSIGDIQKLGAFTNKHFSVLSRYRQLIVNLDPHHKSDMDYIKMKEKLDKKIKYLKK